MSSKNLVHWLLCKQKNLDNEDYLEESRNKATSQSKNEYPLNDYPKK